MPSAQTEAAPRQRLFLALWPDEDVRRRLTRVRDRAAAEHRGRPVAAENLHITLAFLGASDGRQRACAERAAGQVRAAPFTLVLERVGYWPRPRVFWVGSEQTPAPLSALVGALQQGLAECGFSLDERPFQPHITVLRKVPPRPRFEPLLDDPIEWPVNHFHLVASVTRSTGAEYRIIGTWPLAGDQQER